MQRHNGTNRIRDLWIGLFAGALALLWGGPALAGERDRGHERTAIYLGQGGIHFEHAGYLGRYRDYGHGNYYRRHGHRGHHYKKHAYRGHHSWKPRHHRRSYRNHYNDDYSYRKHRRHHRRYRGYDSCREDHDHRSHRRHRH